MDAGFVNGVDGSGGVGISGEKSALGIRMYLHGLQKKADAIHLRHALICKQKGDGIVASFKLSKRRKRGAGRVGAHDAISIGVTAAKVSLDGAKDFGVVVNGE
jgi:hypothetical protein